MTIEARLKDALHAPPSSADEPPDTAIAERAAREGLVDISYGTIDTEIGKLLVATTARGIVRIAYLDTEADAEVIDDLARRLSPRLLRHEAPLERARRQLDEYLAGRRRDFELELDWALSGPFARRVLTATARIPYGKASTYGEIARTIGHPRAARAAGNALARNAIPIVVPCHRVLRGGGQVGGYGGGPDRKRALLALEGFMR